MGLKGDFRCHAGENRYPESHPLKRGDFNGMTLARPHAVTATPAERRMRHRRFVGRFLL
jgi:hypothetical protein